MFVEFSPSQDHVDGDVLRRKTWPPSHTRLEQRKTGYLRHVPPRPHCGSFHRLVYLASRGSVEVLARELYGLAEGVEARLARPAAVVYCRCAGRTVTRRFSSLRAVSVLYALQLRNAMLCKA